MIWGPVKQWAVADETTQESNPHHANLSWSLLAGICINCCSWRYKDRDPESTCRKVCLHRRKCNMNACKPFNLELTETPPYSLHPSLPWLIKMSCSSLPLPLPASLLRALCHFVHLLSPNMVNGTRPRHRRISIRHVCSRGAADKHPSLVHGRRRSQTHLSPLWLQPKTRVWKSRSVIVPQRSFIQLTNIF